MIWESNAKSFPWAPVQSIANIEVMWEDLEKAGQGRYIYTSLQAYVSLHLHTNVKRVNLLLIVVRHTGRGNGTRMLELLRDIVLAKGYSFALNGPYAKQIITIAER